MFDSTALIVTTRGRIDMQYTLSNLQPEVLKHVSIVCFPGEATEHHKNWGGKVKSIIEHEDWCSNIDQIRFWCLMYFSEDYIIFMDDNLNFYTRRQSDTGNDCKFPLTRLSNLHFSDEVILQVQKEMFGWMIENLSSYEYGIVGISCRSGNQNHEHETEVNTRVYAFWGINKEMFNIFIEEYNIDPYTFKGDFYTFLFMLTHGFANICSYKYAFNKTGGANNKGGCSIYRTNDVITKEAYQLQRDFPDFVKIRKKKSKSWNNLEDEIVDVTISWKKAFEYGQRKYQS